jgi:precorrin-6Y C5,15-methyltransferase (decarboxylating)
MRVMTEPWLSIIGLGEDGLTGLPAASREALAGAEIVFGAPRHLALAGIEGLEWPVPFSVAPLLAHRGRRVAALVSGDPFWHGAGSALAKALAPGEWRCHPVAGTFSLAAARLGWRLEEVTCLGLHAAPFARLRPVMARGARAICLLRDGDAPRALAGWLTARGMGATRITVLQALGGPREHIWQAQAADFTQGCTAPVAVALDGADLPAESGLPRGFGLPDDAFAHDGQITRRAVRAVTLAHLAPRADELLWDIGGGSGSVSVEWCLNGGRALTIEPRSDRLANIAANIDAFGLLGRMRAVAGKAAGALAGLAAPDAIFIGGGADPALIRALPPARLVINAVTLETEALVAMLHAERGGSLTRLAVEEAAPLGRMRGWTPARSVTIWSST